MVKMSEAHKLRLEELKAKPEKSIEEEQEIKMIEEYLATLEMPNKTKDKRKEHNTIFPKRKKKGVRE